VSAASLSQPDRSPADSPARKTGVLVVDDEKIVRGFLALGLRAAGFAVWQADGGRAAVDLYRAHRDEIDVVLLDVRMPGMDGAQTFAALRELNPAVPCCFMSGDPGDVSIAELLTRGAAGFLAKPFSVADVTALVRRAARPGG
jgi:CheY-like chemotaxis protein